MINFDNIAYLKIGNEKQQKVYQVLMENQVMEKLSGFSPILTGTIPIEIDTEDSDLDIICYWKTKKDFFQACFSFSDCLNYQLIDKKVNGYETVIAKFVINNFQFEIFGQNRPTKEQEAYQHMIIEYRILQSKGIQFKRAIIALKQKGVKTEPAFGLLIGLKQNPYADLLTYFEPNF